MTEIKKNYWRYYYELQLRPPPKFKDAANMMDWLISLSGCDYVKKYIDQKNLLYVAEHTPNRTMAFACE